MATKTKRRRSSVPVIPIVFAAVIVLALGVLLFSITPGAGAEGETYGEVEVLGEPLPPYPGNEGQDPAVGATAPEIDGLNHDEEPEDLTWDGTPKALLFLAHWCPACQAEVPVVQGIVDDGEVPDGIDLVAINTWADSRRELYPPQEWLADEGWTPRTIADDEDYTIAQSYGMESSPFWVLVDGEGTVLGRLSGQIPEDQIPVLFDQLLEEEEL